jgi:hypothetical protein
MNSIVMNRQVSVELLDDSCLDAVCGGGPDGGAPAGTQTTTTTTKTENVTVKGKVEGGYKGVISAGAEGTYENGSTTTTTTIQCSCPNTGWRGVPWR